MLCQLGQGESYLICSPVGVGLPAYSVELRDPKRTVPEVQLMKDIVVFRDGRKVANVPVAPQDLASVAAKRVYKVGEFTVTLAPGQPGSPVGTLGWGATTLDLACRTGQETENERFTRFERTYRFPYFPSQKDCDDARKQDPRLSCFDTMTLQPNGDATLIVGDASLVGKFSRQGLALEFTFPKAVGGYLEKEKFQLAADWTFLQRDDDLTVWILE